MIVDALGSAPRGIDTSRPAYKREVIIPVSNIKDLIGHGILDRSNPYISALLAGKLFLGEALEAARARRVVTYGLAPEVITCYVGPAGSGKDTQADADEEVLADLGISSLKVSTGDAFKAALKNVNNPFHETSLRDASLMSQGKLANDDGILDIFTIISI